MGTRKTAVKRRPRAADRKQLDRRKELQDKLTANVDQHNQLAAKIEELSALRHQAMGRCQVYREELEAAGGPLEDGPPPPQPQEPETDPQPEEGD